NPAGLSYTYQYEKDHITITDSLDRREVLHTQGEAGLKRVVKKEHADGSVTQSQFDAVGRLRTQTDAAGRTTEYSPDVVTGLITRITTPDGRASAFYYNHHSQLTSATGPDGLELRREYDESGRLIQETAPDGDITRYRYDNPHSDLPCATDDATGSRKTMTWSRYGQLLSFTDCSGYQTRYDHDRFGQMTAVHREEGLSQYITQDPIGLKGGWNFYQYPLNPISNIDPLGLETLKCIKPLHSMGGTGERSGPDIWGNPFYHQYLCVPDGKGDYTCGGQDQRGESKGDGLWGPGKASNDTKEAAGRCDLVETDNSCVENCLKGKFKEVRPRYSVLPDIFTPINLGLFKNCQDWSNDSLETCKMKCSGNNIGRFIRFVFTGVM
ncbi:TPA: RHS repeat protein, partial [Escherichia coli]|nr:RHS repeat protein [Escherichia coli]